MSFLERFQELLHENNVTITEVALKTGIPRSTISSYIHRKSSPSVIQLELIADYFDCSIDYLVGRNDDFDNKANEYSILTNNEKRLLKAFIALDELTQEKLIEDAEFYATRTKKNK